MNYQTESFQKENNLFQSVDWLAFQTVYGRQTVTFGDFDGLVFDLPLGQKFVWVQKGPDKISNFQLLPSNLPKGTVFVRLEPAQIPAAEVKKLRPVTHNSLLSGQVSPKATRVLDISGSEEEILAQMKQKTRYNIRLAEKKGVTVKVLDDAEVLFELLQKTAKRDKGYAPHPKSYYVKMVEILGKSDAVHIFVAEHEGDVLAAILVGFSGNTAIYLHGGFDETKRSLMAPYLCQWEAIKYAKSKGKKYYDFWGVAETDDSRDPWAGISRFKEGFGGEKVIFPGGYDLVLSKFWYNFLTFAAKLKHLIR